MKGEVKNNDFNLLRNGRAWYFKVCFNNNNYYIYTYIISGLLGMGDKIKKK